MPLSLTSALSRPSWLWNTSLSERERTEGQGGGEGGGGVGGEGEKESKKHHASLPPNTTHTFFSFFFPTRKSQGEKIQFHPVCWQDRGRDKRDKIQQSRGQWHCLSCNYYTSFNTPSWATSLFTPPKPCISQNKCSAQTPYCEFGDRPHSSEVMPFLLSCSLLRDGCDLRTLGGSVTFAASTKSWWGGIRRN